MNRFTTSLLCLMLLAFAAQVSHADDDEADQEISLYLKSGDILPGTLVKVDEDGVKLDIGGGTELFVRWSYTRGDKHFDLRKSATDFTKLESVIKLADFCHDFAMDEQEAHVLTAALILDPAHKALRERLEKLPKIDGLEAPDESTPKPDPDTEPDEPVKPDNPLPPPTRKPFTVFVKLTKADDAAAAWMIKQFEELNYGIGTEKDHEILVELTVTLTLTNNPEFMGAELYAIYDGSIAYKLYRKGETKAFGSGTVKKDQVKGDNRDEARTRTRTQLCEAVFPDMHTDIEKLR